MPIRAGIMVAAVTLVVTGCTAPAPKSAETKSPETALPPKITQFYATAPQLHRGEQETLCYGVENATYVWVSPPRQVLTTSHSRCFDVAPSQTTVYRLTAEGADGKSVFQEVTVEVGAPKAKIVEVRVSTLNAKRGETVSICYDVLNVQSVTIEPIHYKAGSRLSGCTTHQPTATTTYTLSAIGANGEKDQEKVTVKIQ